MRKSQRKNQRKKKLETMQQTLQLLQERHLEKEYAAANNEVDPIFEITADDGLSDEDW